MTVGVSAMARRTEHDPVKAERTRISATMVAVTVAVIFLILLVIFIAQNNRSVPVYFLGANGHVSEAVALLASALVGALLVLLIGIARITQLRLAGARHNRRMAKQEAAAQPPAGSAGASTQGESKPVQPED
jgi:uncharacterized integral membrane protein